MIIDYEPLNPLQNLFGQGLEQKMGQITGQGKDRTGQGSGPGSRGIGQGGLGQFRAGIGHDSRGSGRDRN